MKIFEKRPLALILCIMLGGFPFFVDFDWKIKLILASVSLFIISIIYLFDTLKQGRKTIVVISLVAFSISLILSAIWTSIFFPIKYYDSDPVNITAKIYSIDNSDSTTSKIIFKSEVINDKKDKHTFIAYVDKDIAVILRNYDVVNFMANVSEFSLSDDGFDGKSYYISKGYSAFLNNISEIHILDNDVDFLNSFFQNLQLKISNTLKLRTDFDTGSLLAALIVGNRSDLNGNTRLNFARLGISHILALSGMHLAILSIAINTILIKLGIKKKPRVCIMLILVIFYMALTGFTSSVLRSGIMLIISYILFLAFSKADALTSLTISVFLIVVIDPTSVYDMSLWLSAFATLGVVVFSEIAEKPDKDSSKFSHMWISFKNACLVSVFAFSATFVFTVLRFDYFSILTIITTLIFSFLIQILIYAGLLLLVIGGMIPFGKIIIFFSNVILLLAETISSFKFIYVSMNFFVVKILIVLLTVFFFAFLILEIKKKKRAIIIILSILLSIFAVAEIDTINNIYNDDVIFSPSTSGDMFIIKSDGDVTAIYSGKAFSDNSWDILDCFSEQGIPYIDNFVLASYSYSTIDFTKAVLNGIKIEKIMIPSPKTTDELNQAEGLSYLLEGYGTTLKFYDEIEYISFGNVRYRLFDKADYTYGTYPANVIEISCNENKITYVSTCKYDNLSASAKALLYNSENLIIGSIGNTKYYLFDFRISKIKKIYYFDDGRLTDEAYEYYNKNGASMNCTKTPLSIFN